MSLVCVLLVQQSELSECCFRWEKKIVSFDFSDPCAIFEVAANQAWISLARLCWQKVFLTIFPIPWIFNSILSKPFFAQDQDNFFLSCFKFPRGHFLNPSETKLIQLKIFFPIFICWKFFETGFVVFVAQPVVIKLLQLWKPGTSGWPFFLFRCTSRTKIGAESTFDES